MSAVVSQDDMRLRLMLSSCNAELEVEAAEAGEEVTVTAADVSDSVHSGDCLDS